MCGRYYVEDDLMDEIRPLVQHEGKDLRIQKSSDIFPSEKTTIIGGTRDELYAFDMKWGMPSVRKGQLLINARAETVMEKQSFSEAVQKYRCVIPASGFYEWTKEKQKVSFACDKKSAIYMAGCYKKTADVWTFVIITAAANENVLPFHDRMPLILTADEVRNWILDTSYTKEYLGRPVMSELMPIVIGK